MENLKSKALLESILDYVLISVGAFLYAVGFNWFFTTNMLAYGGITGIILIFDYLLGGIPVGTILILCNIPIFLMGGKLLGKKMLFRSIYAMFLSSALLDVISYNMTFEPMDEILASIYGGVVLGASMALILLRNASTGGTDLLSRVIRLKISWIPVGKMMLIMDIFIISITAIVTKNMDNALYGLIAMYVTALVMDNITYGVDKSQVAYIISNKHQEMTKALTEKLHRGVTVIPSLGGWSGEPRPMVMCAFRQRQVVALKNLIQEVDPDAFFICCPAYEVLGYGFRKSGG